MGARSPQTLGGSGSSLMLYVKDVDTLFKQALAAGAKEVRPLKNQFYGDRSGCLEDPFGHTWTISTHVEDVSQEEVDHRFAEACKKMATA
jgi:PhnB protein